ncbi:lysophospholipid acyltransferase family protein [Herbiconiux moechotypicola]|uniref:Lysophospholipid acyltransferase family protein n=1 Tax=Herbiconiux moechotypicola TaxID=637393 RepID=A0ABN3DYG9_9MICO
MPKRRRHERTVAFTVIEAIVVPFLNAISKLDIRHGERVPASGPFVLSPNHYSNIDPVIMAWAVWKLGRAPRFMAKASLFTVPVVGFALRRSGQIPVERAGANRGNAPIAAANDLVEHERGVIVYPEGTLTRDPDMWPMRGKSGAVRLALEHGIPLIPAAHWGTQAVLPRYSKKLRLFPRKTILVDFGEPLDLDDLRGQPITQKVLQEGTDRLMAAITALLEGLRGETAPAERWNPAAHNQTEFGRIADGGDKREAS